MIRKFRHLPTGAPSSPSETSTAAVPGRGTSGGWARGLLDRSPYLLALLLALAVVSFGVYYYTDRQVSSGPSLVERQTGQLEEAVRSQPGSFPARLALAKAYESSRRYPAAIEQYQAALTIEADNVEASLGLARTQLSAGDTAAAEAGFQKIVEQRQGSEFAPMDNYLRDARYYLGETFLRQQRYDAAIEQLNGALDIDAVDADAWWRLCEAQVGSGDNNKAIDSCQRAVRLVPNFAEAYQLMAQAYQNAGQPLQARYATAMVLYSSAKHAQAVAELQAVVAEDPTYWEAYVGLGLALEGKGDRAAAVTAYQQALAGDPENLLATMGVARLSGTHP